MGSQKGLVEHDLTITDVINTAGWKKKGTTAYRGSHPVHGSDTGTNTVVDTAQNVAYCFRCDSGGGPLLWIALEEGIISSCDDMGEGVLTGKEFIEACEIANKKYNANIDIGDIDEEEIEKKGYAREVLSHAEELTHGQLKQDREKWNRIKEERSLDDEDITEIKIGYWNDTVTETLKERYDLQALVNSGLFKINCPEEDCDISFKNIEQLEKHTDKEFSKEHLYPIIGGRITFPYKRYSKTLYFIGRRTKETEDYWYSQVEENIKEIEQEILENPDTEADSLQEAKDTWVSRQSGKYVKICQTDYNEHIIWQEFKDREELVITEGIYDAISAHKAGYSVASPITTRFNSNDIKKIVEISKDFEKIHLVFDGDTAGKEGQQETAKQLTKKGVEPNLVTLDAGKDLDDWTNSNGYSIDSLLGSGDRYLDTLIQKAEDAEGRSKVDIREEIYRLTADWKARKAKWIFRELSGSTRENKSDWKDVKSEIQKEQERKKKKEQLPKEKEGEDREEKITDTLKVKNPGEEIHINPRPEIYINQLEETATETKINEYGTVDKKPQFKIYDIQFGKGTEENTYKLLVEPWRNLSLGEGKLPIKKANLMQSKYKDSEYFKEKYKDLKAEIDDFSKTYTEWLKSIEGSQFIELQDQIDQRSREVVEELPNDVILEMVREYLRAGWYTDSKLRSVMYPQIVQHDKSKVQPDKVSKYQPHTQMWTNTKVGKSETAKRVGRKLDDATPAGLLGYADSDGKQEGILNGLDVPVFIDEFNFGSSSRQLNDQLLSLMEAGEFEQTKAGHSIRTKFYGNMTYMANPKDSDLPVDHYDSDDLREYNQDRSSFELVSQFEELIQFLGMNIQAMASRFGVIIFDEEMDTASSMEEVELKDERFQKLETFVEWVKQEVAKEYTEIERELRPWLEKEYEQEYKDRVNELREKTKNEKVNKFWKNHLESYRHARGQALRMSVFQNIGDVINDDYDLKDIKEEAENQWETVKEINRESLEKMTEATDDEQQKSRSRSKIDSYDPKYLRLFMKSVIKYHQKQGSDEVGMIHLFEDLKPVYNDLKDDLPNRDVNEDSRYWKWSKVRKQVEDNLNKKRLNLEQDFGVEIFRRDGDHMFRVKVPERFENFLDLDIGVSEDSESDSDSSENESKQDSDGGSDDLLIEGEYNPDLSGVRSLVEDNQGRYEEDAVPEGEIVKYFGRRFNGNRYSKVMECIEKLLHEGDISEVMDGLYRTQ